MRHRTRRTAWQVYTSVFLGLLAFGWPALLPVPDMAKVVVFWVNMAAVLALVIRFGKAIGRWLR